MDDPIVIVSVISKLEELGLAGEVFAVFKRAEGLVLKCRDLPPNEGIPKLEIVRNYVNRRLDRLVEAGILTADARQDQYAKGVLYLQCVAGSGIIP